MSHFVKDSDLCQKVLEVLKTKVSDFHFNNWFKGLEWKQEAENRIVVSVPSKFVRDWLIENYLSLIKFEVFKLAGIEHEIIFKVVSSVASSVASKTSAITTNLSTWNKAPAKKNEPSVLRSSFGLNPRYTFDSFVVGGSNQFVHAGALAVASGPGKNYNPFYIYGGVGLGKTHLLNAIGLKILEDNPSARILLVTGEQFTNEVINAIRYQKTLELRQKYRVDCDVLLIDDIQFIAGKERTMEEFFHTFNALFEARKQIVLTSDVLPKEIAHLEERLLSRFNWGLMADVQAPEIETRMAILRKKAEDDKIEISDEVCQLIASHVKTNIRDLEGCLVRVAAMASLSKTAITTDIAREVLRKVVGHFGPTLTIEAIQQMVANHFQIKVADLKSPRRHKNLAGPRQIAMFLCKKHLQVSYPQIGSKFGGKDHTTVIHAFQKINGTMNLDPILRENVDVLERLISKGA